MLLHAIGVCIQSKHSKDVKGKLCVGGITLGH